MSADSPPPFTPRIRDRMFRRAVGALLLASIGVIFYAVGMHQQTGRYLLQGTLLKVVFPRADGLLLNGPVSVLGLKAGRVQHIDLGADHLIHVTLELDSSYLSLLRADAQAVLVKPLIGSSYIDMFPGSLDQAPLGTGQVLKGQTQSDVNDLIAGIPQRLERLDAAVAQIESLSGDLRHLTQAATTGDSSVITTLQNIQTVSAQAAVASQGLQGVLVQAQSALTSMTQTGAAAQSLLTDLTAGSQHVAPLALKLDAVLDDLQIVSHELREVAPNIRPAAAVGREVLHDAGSVMNATKNHFLFRGGISPAPPLPIVPDVR